jgi:hypothetical protein
MTYSPKVPVSRRACLALLAAAPALATRTAQAQNSKTSFDQWVATFRARAQARGISDATYTRVMSNLKPDTTVFALIRSQPEFNEELWQYLNRRVSDWRITAGKEKAKEYASLFDRIEKDYGVDRSIMLGLWGIESAYGDPDVQKNHMRPVFPALAALAWGEPRRRPYWEQELLNALVIIAAGARPRKCAVPGPAPWATPNGCRRCGSTSASTMTATGAPARSASLMTALPAPPDISSSAANISRASIGVTKCAPAQELAKARHAPSRRGRRPA